MSAGLPVRVRSIDASGRVEAELVVLPGSSDEQVTWRDPEHAILAGAADAAGSGPGPSRLVVGAARRRVSDGLLAREVLIDGWRVEVELEAEARAALRDRARRGAPARTAGGPLEIRAELPGRIVRLLVAPGDQVDAGQQLLAIEAMKMLNELRAPRAGRVRRVAVAAGAGVDLGDLLVVLD
ncbi:MAG TPA: acetyl-CoA carboxylase biotin carboxyl carrier protein subunit [Candidatus Limnocylindrales bacterium]|jgi:biotin carboxyl carrier protein